MNWTGGRRNRAGGNAPSAPAHRQKQYFARVRAAQTSAAFSGHASSDDSGPSKRRKVVMPSFNIVVGQCGRKKSEEPPETKKMGWIGRAAGNAKPVQERIHMRPPPAAQLVSSPHLPATAPSVVTAASRNYGPAAAFRQLSDAGYLRIGRTTLPQPSDDISQDSMLLDHEEDVGVQRFSSSDWGGGTEGHFDSDPFVPRCSPGTVLRSEHPDAGDGLLRDLDEAVGMVYRPLSRAGVVAVASETPESPTGYRSVFLSANPRIPTSEVSSTVAADLGGVEEVSSEEEFEEMFEEETQEEEGKAIAEGEEPEDKQHHEALEHGTYHGYSLQNDEDRWRQLLPAVDDASESESKETHLSHTSPHDGIRTDIAEVSQDSSEGDLEDDNISTKQDETTTAIAENGSNRSSPTESSPPDNENTTWKSFITQDPLPSAHPESPPPPNITFTEAENRAWGAFVFAFLGDEEHEAGAADEASVMADVGSSPKCAGSSGTWTGGGSCMAAVGSSPKSVASSESLERVALVGKTRKPVFKIPSRFGGVRKRVVGEELEDIEDW